VVNKKALESAIKVALALNSKVNNLLVFTRKHYFYPDLPKNYQISQYDGIGGLPISKGGYLKIRSNNGWKTIRIRRINIEEDPGRLVYPTGSILTSKYTLIDYNRSGIALLEIVTEPDINSPKEARQFIEKLASILEHLDVTDPKLEGALRVDANVSTKGGNRVEIKNIGSPRDVEKALAYEVVRQRKAIELGEKVLQETRHWDSVRKITVRLRIKETEEDYRYFPDPDLPPIKIDKKLIEQIRNSLPELPDQRIPRFVRQYSLSEYLATVLVMEKALADHFEECVKICGNPQLIGNILVNELKRWTDELNLNLDKALKLLNPSNICKLIDHYLRGTISIKILKKIIPDILKEGKDVETLIEERELTKIMDVNTLSKLIDEVFEENPKAVKDALTNPNAINFLVGQVMKKTKGRADPKLTNELIIKKLREIVLK
jgi:aspartyl-tRNA(Asn)/glutamyl-tRNA(Gln) amidotransferase subunit B